MSGKHNSNELLELLSYFDEEMYNTVNVASYFEWNTYRVFKHLGGYINITPNFTLDSNMLPISTAASGKEDILIEYPNFYLLIECTLRTGESQLDYEADSVSRHLKNFSDNNTKKAFTLFLAPSINVNFTKMISREKAQYPIIPLSIKQFQTLLKKRDTEDFSKFLLSELINLLRPDLNHKSAAEWLKHIETIIFDN